MNINRQLSVVSLFSGCGGLDLGFHQAGYSVVFANDIEKSIEATYRHNLGNIVIGDINHIKLEDIPADFDVLLAGIPCQPFSNAGNRKGMDDIRGRLFLRVMEIVKAKKPKVVVFENVKGFLSAKDDNQIPLTERVTNDFQTLGYHTYYKLLNASDYEVPQNRQRVFIVGVANDLSKEFYFPEPIPKNDTLTVGYVLNRPINEMQEIWNLAPQARQLVDFIPAGGSWKNIPYEHLPERLKKIRDDMKRYHSPNFFRRFNLNEIMGTITASATPENSGIIHPLQPRRYSVREIARFQSFPDSFEFIGASTPKKYKMIGNAVPPRLAFHLANAIKKQLLV